jgi:hypothetical protein
MSTTKVLAIIGVAVVLAVIAASTAAADVRAAKSLSGRGSGVTAQFAHLSQAEAHEAQAQDSRAA